MILFVLFYFLLALGNSKGDHFNLLTVIIIIIKITADQNNNDKSRIDAFYRCISDEDLPNFNNSEPSCSVMVESLSSTCESLMLFADYLANNDVPLDELPDLNITTNFGEILNLKDTAYSCSIALYYDLRDIYNVYVSYEPLNLRELFELETCDLDIFGNLSRTSNNCLNYDLYTFMTAVEISWSLFYYDEISRSAITESFLHTCITEVHINNLDACIRDLFDSCFELERLFFYEPFLCYDSVLIKLCNQFGGDERYKCFVIVELKLIQDLKDNCAEESHAKICVS